MTQRNKVLVVGSANMDLSMNMYRIPNEGETVIDDGGVAYTPGGKGANAAMALMKVGAKVVFCAKLGQDVHGQRLFNYYKYAGMDVSCLKADPDFPTGLAVVMKEADGKNRIVVYPGANGNITNENVIDAFSSNPDAVYIGFEIPFNIALTAAKVASAKGIPIFIDSAPAKKEHPLEALPEIEIFSPNESETEEYTGISPAGVESSLRAALALYKRVKAKYIVIKQGARGAFIYDGKHYDTIPAIRADKTVDTTAAGDAFTAAMVAEYMRNGGDIKSAVIYANAAGAITVTRAGASSSVATDAEIRALLSKNNY